MNQALYARMNNKRKMKKKKAMMHIIKFPDSNISIGAYLIPNFTFCVD
jgi:hypothetical protein